LGSGGKEIMMNTIENTEAVGLLKRHFDTALETPDGVKKLRELILTLAMQGKLVKQDPKDQPASELLKDGEAKKSLPKLGLEEISFKIPQHWVWCRLAEIAHSLSTGPFGTMLHKSDYVINGIPLVNPMNIVEGKIIPSGKMQISEKTKERLKSYVLEEGDIVIGRRGEMGRCAVVTAKENGWLCGTGSFFVKLADFIDREYFVIFFGSDFSIKYLTGLSVGATMNNLNHKILNNLPFPLPPLLEQKRIVAKIDSLMSLCDKLEAQRNERNNKRLKIHTAATVNLLSSKDKIDFNNSWHFITKNFNDLYSVPENVTELKKVILQLAVMGKLVPQDPKDQPASELLKEIEVEKKSLIKEGNIKKQDPYAPIKTENIPYEVPKGWEWVRLSQIGLVNPRNNFDDNKEAGFVPMPLIFAEYGIPHKFEIKKWSDIKKGFTHFANNDVGLAKITPCFENRKSCVFQGLPNEIGAGTTELHIFRNSFKTVFPKYVLIYFKNPNFIKTGISVMTGSAGQKRVPTDYFAYHPFPLPPLAEQRRIVSKIDQLFALCDSLEQSLHSATTKQTSILNAVLSKI